MLELTERLSDALDSQKSCCDEAQQIGQELPNFGVFILVGL